MAKKKRQQQKKARNAQDAQKAPKPLPAPAAASPSPRAAAAPPSPRAVAVVPAPAVVAAAPVVAVALSASAVVAPPVVVAAAPPIAAASAQPAAARELSPDADARTHKRLPFEVNLDIVSEHNFYAGLTLNVSEGGLFVATHVQHPVGTRLEIRLVFPGDEAPTSLMTEVRWVRLGRDAGDSSPGMGLRFVDLPAPVLEKIGRFARHREPLYYEED